MIENIVIFVLGALAASLVALFVGPIFARRAARLAAQRVRAAAPLTTAEIQAQKDLLRAEFAVRVRKVELRLEKMERLAAERQIELGRHEESLRERQIELASRKEHIQELEGEVDSLRTAILALEKQTAEQAAALKEKQKAISAANDALHAREAELDEARSLIDSQKVEIVALKTQLENQHDRVEDLRAELAVRAVEAEEHAAAADDLKDTLRAREKIIALRDGRIAKRRKLAALRRRQMNDLRGELATARTEIATRALAVEALEADAAERNERIVAQEQERSNLSRTVADLEARLDLRERELARLQDQIAAFRKDPESGAGDAPNAAELRESINQLAARIVSRTANGRDDEIRKLIDAASSGSHAQTGSLDDKGERRGHVPLAERIKEIDLQPGE
jgi:chromosome segregation ATPase